MCTTFLAISVTRSTRSWSCDPSLPSWNPPTSRTTVVLSTEKWHVYIWLRRRSGDHAGLWKRLNTRPVSSTLSSSE